MTTIPSNIHNDAFGNMKQPTPNHPPDILSGSVKDPDEEAGKTPYYAMETAVPPVRGESFEEFEDDMQSVMAESIVDSVLTADGIHDLAGFNIVCLVILVGDMSRGVMFPSMWPLVANLGGSTVTLGYSVAAFSFGRILVSPLFGSWSIQYGYSKTLMFSCSILLLGTLMYAQAQNVGRTEFLIIAQTMLGIGSGTLGVTRAFVAEITAQRNRTTYMAWVTAVQYAGFTVTPFVGAFFNYIFGDFDFQYGIFRLNMYTAPAYFMTIVIALTMFAMARYFKDRTRTQTSKDIKQKSKLRTEIDDHANRTTAIGLTVYDCCILGCMLLNVSTKGSISSFETLGISLAMSHFDMFASRAGTIVACCGTIGVVSLLCMGHLTKHFTDIQLICGGMGVMAVGIFSLSFVEEIEVNPSWRFTTAIFMIYSIGYPIGHTAVIGMFSKIVGRRPQGTLLGWFASAGSLARIVFPIMSGYIANYEGIHLLFWILTAILIASTSFTVYNGKTLQFLSL